MKKLYLYLFFIFIWNHLLSQIDTALLLPSIQVKATPIRQSAVGTRVESYNSTYLTTYSTTSIAKMLQEQGGIFIKSYGGGSLATTSMRGGSAGHTAVLWNGFSIQSPMLGLLDVALLPVHFMDKVQLQYGGNSALWGSGAIGGVIAFDNQAKFDNAWQGQLQLSGGSFGERNLQTKWRYSNKKIAVSIRLFRQQAENDFFYNIRPDLPEKQQSNAALSQNGWLSELYYKINAKQILSFWGWWQTVDRQIPPLTTQSVSEAIQQDSILRLGLHWRHTDRRWIWQFRTAFFKERQSYRDPINREDARNLFWTTINEATGDWQFFKNQKLHLGINYTFTSAFARAYGTTRSENRQGIFAAYLWEVLYCRLRLSLRQGWYNGQRIPITPSFNFESAITPYLELETKISRNYRLPTLNDRYWGLSGRSDLLPESGWSEEITFRLKPFSKKTKLSYSATIFNRNIQNWIIWLRQENGIWSPRNINQVWSRGIEQRVNWRFMLKGFDFRVKAGYDYIRSTNQKTENTAALYKQLIYVPIHQSFGGLQVKWRAFQWAYQHNYTGHVFIRGDNSMELSAYHLGYFQASWSKKWEKMTTRLFLNIDNIWNASYRIIERRPMAGRSWEVGLSCDWKSIKAHTTN